MALKLYIEDGEAIPSYQYVDDSSPPSGYTETDDPIDWDAAQMIVGDTNLLYYTTLRDRLDTAYQALSTPTAAQTAIASKWYVVDKAVRDTTSRNQLADAEALYKLFAFDHRDNWSSSLTALDKTEADNLINYVAIGTTAMALGAEESWIAYASGTWVYITQSNEQFITRISTGANSGRIRRSHKVEPDIRGVPANGVSVETRTSTVEGSMTMTVYVNGVADTNLDSVDIKPTATGVWETKTFSFASAPSADDSIMIEIIVTSTGPAQEHSIDNIQIKYNN